MRERERERESKERTDLVLSFSKGNRIRRQRTRRQKAEDRRPKISITIDGQYMGETITFRQCVDFNYLLPIFDI